LQLSPEHLSEILGKETGWLRVGEHGDKLICWAQSRITGWKLILSLPYSMIVAPARHLAKESLVIGCGGVLILMGVVFFTARRISEPIALLQSMAANFERGSYDEGKDVIDRIGRRRDELGRFAKSFSAMAREIQLREERLSEWNANLEKTVKDRTADLAAAMAKVKKVNAAMEAELAEAASYSRAVLPEKFTGPVSTDWVFISSSQLGGDSFGYKWIDDDSLAIYLLDVCGHGVGAALLSISVVNVLRNSSLADTDFHNPSQVLEKLNTSFPMERHNDMYFTAWYGVYSRSTGILKFACGGHPPAVLIAPDGTANYLTAKGAVVGALPKASYETASVTVLPGSRLYLFSDGTYEIDRPDSTMMTHEEFAKILKEPAVGTASKLDTVVDDVRRQQAKETFADDFSLVEFTFGGSVT
jgi:serine phosphatase RsbU (regulator of sigma subunit)